MKTNKKLYQLLVVLAFLLAACNNNPATDTRVSLNFDVHGLYNQIVPRSADEIKLTLEVKLFVNEQEFDSQSNDFDSTTGTLSFGFSSVPYGSMVYAEGKVISRETVDGKVQEEIKYSGKSDTVTVTQDETLLALILEEYKKGSEEGGSQEQGSNNDQIEGKDTYSILVTLGGGACDNYEGQTGIVADAIYLYAVKADLPQVLTAEETTPSETISTEKLMSLVNLVDENDTILLKEYKHSEQTVYNEKISIGEDYTITITDSFNKSVLGQNTDSDYRLLAIVGYRNPLSNSFTEFYYGYSDSFKFVTERNDQSKPEDEPFVNDIDFGMVTMGGTPVVFNFYYRDQNNTDTLMPQYTTAASIPNLDGTYALYRTVQDYVPSTIRKLEADGYKYANYIWGSWKGILKLYNVYFEDISYTGQGNLLLENYGLTFGLSDYGTLHLEGNDDITFIAYKKDNTAINEEEAASLTWTAILTYDGKKINSYANPDNTFYSVSGNCLMFNSEHPLDAPGLYQLYVTVMWHEVVSSQTFTLTVSQ